MAGAQVKQAVLRRSSGLAVEVSALSLSFSPAPEGRTGLPCCEEGGEGG